jgi:hypothetical protein
MHELDPFELRLAAVLHAMADEADTRVDAAAVARDAIGRRPFWAVAWSGLRIMAPVPVLLAIVLSLALVASVALVGAWRDRGLLSAPMPSATSTPVVAPAPTVSPRPTRDGVGVEYVTGTGTFSIVSPGTTVDVDGGTQVRGFMATSTVVLDDPRVTGTGTLRLSIDTFGRVGTEWGTYRLETADGAWEGTVAGGSWNDGDASDVTGYLVGSGDYEGYSLYIDVRSSGFAMELEGIIFPGPPPGP